MVSFSIIPTFYPFIIMICMIKDSLLILFSYDYLHCIFLGSRLTNYVGILSQGLRIAPPEAPSTGYMFGKGVYFADMVSNEVIIVIQAEPIILAVCCYVKLH